MLAVNLVLYWLPSWYGIPTEARLLRFSFDLEVPAKFFVPFRDEELDYFAL